MRKIFRFLRDENEIRHSLEIRIVFSLTAQERMFTYSQDWDFTSLYLQWFQEDHNFEEFLWKQNRALTVEQHCLFYIYYHIVALKMHAKASNPLSLVPVWKDYPSLTTLTLGEILWAHLIHPFFERRKVFIRSVVPKLDTIREICTLLLGGTRWDEVPTQGATWVTVRSLA